MGQADSCHLGFWSWFPFGIAGIRAFFLFLCGLSIIVLRIAQYHVGLRTSNSAIQTFTQNVLQLQTLETLFSYSVSAWLFSQIYLLSMGEGSGLEWITIFSGDRARLNEKPVFLTAHLLFIAAYHSAYHLYRDSDRLFVGAVKRIKDNSAQESSNPIKRFINEIPTIFIAAVTVSVGLLIPGLIVYPLFVRSTAWPLTLSLFRPFYNLPKSNMRPVALPYHWSTLTRSVWTGFLLSFLWMMGNSAFSIFLIKEPLKNGKPLTSESKDPNGSLLNGLKSKKQSIKAFALWELAFIARDYKDRRESIYQDIDRKDGPMWSQVYGICLDHVKMLETRVDTYNKPPAKPASPPEKKDKDADEPQRLTKPITEQAPLQPTPVKAAFRAEVERAVTKATTDPNQPSRLSPIAKKAVADAKEKISAVRREFGGGEDPNSPVQAFTRRILSSPLGWPFRQEFRRRITAVVLGTPYGEPSLYINAVSSLSQLAVHSLTEDKYGNVQRDIASIVRTFTSATKKLDQFKATFPVHWSDTRKDRTCPEVDEILEALKDGLSELLVNFGPYSRDLRLSMADMRQAREAAGVPSNQTEMREVR